MSHYKIYLSPPHMGGDELSFIHEAFQSNIIAPLGPQVDAFEKEVADYAGTKGALALVSGTAAIHLALRYLHVKPGDIVLCSSLTFIASANPILYLGATPVFIDAEPDSWNMSPIALQKAISYLNQKNKRPKAIVIVNLYGQSADMASLIPICNQYDIPVIEDAAESLGSTYHHKKSGTFGQMGVFSFNGNKIITTSGGGMLVSDNLDALAKARFWSTQAKDNAIHYQHTEMGYNYRMSNILAAIGRGQLKVLDQHVNACRAIFNRYHEALSSIPGFEFMKELPQTCSNRWLTTVTIDPEKTGITPYDIIQSLESEHIESRPVWKPMHIQPLFKDCLFFSHYQQGESVSEYLFNRGLCLPSGSNLSESDQMRVIEYIIQTIRKRNP